MRIPLLWAFAGVALSLCNIPVSFAQPALPAINTLPTQQRHAALLEKARTQGTVPLIVQLQRGNAGKAYHTAAIAQSQQAVLDAVDGLTHVRLYQQIPFLAVHATPDALQQLLTFPNIGFVQEDEHYGVLLEESTAAIGAAAAWAYGGSGAGQVVAVVDSGVDGNHPFLDGKLAGEACFSSSYESTSSNFVSVSLCPGDEERAYGAGVATNCDPAIEGCSHGTRVAGIVAGRSDDFSGVARDADILALQVFSRFENYCGDAPCVRSWVSDQVAALDYIYQQRDSLNIAAVNLSLGGGHYTDVATCEEVNPAMRILIDMLHDEGIAVIAAAGNSGLSDGLVSPACLSNAISVGATTMGDDIASFSSSATFLDFLAPGQDITTSIPGGGFASSAGTSFSAPHVAGAWAILKAANPDATIETLLATFANTGFQITDDRNDVTTARIQVDLALQATQLPVDLVAFEATATDDKVLLSWRTASETNNAGFEVEYHGGHGFTSLGFVHGHGTTLDAATYNFSADGFSPGWHTFRLKQIDFDGTFAYSLEQQVYIDIDGAFHFGAPYPNPFNPQTQFTLTLARAQHVIVSVYNLVGARVQVLADGILPAEYSHQFTLDGSTLPSGIYIIQAAGEHFKSARSVTLMK
ncbi:MAG: S8 family serine peptidase [Bacteroidota bacterium]